MHVEEVMPPRNIEYLKLEIKRTLDQAEVLETWGDSRGNKPPFVDLFGFFRRNLANSDELLVREGLRPSLPKVKAPPASEAFDAAANSAFMEYLAKLEEPRIHLGDIKVIGGLYVQFRKLEGQGPPSQREEADIDARRDTVAVVLGGVASGVPLDSFSFRNPESLRAEGSRGGFYTYAADVITRNDDPLGGNGRAPSLRTDFHYASAVSRLILENGF